MSVSVPTRIPFDRLHVSSYQKDPKIPLDTGVSITPVTRSKHTFRSEEGWRCVSLSQGL